MIQIIETPWGAAQSSQEIAPGIVRHDTASHGGYYLSPERLAEMPEPLRNFKPWAGENWYEEDCDWCFVALAFPQHFEADAIPLAKRTLSSYQPDVFASWQAWKELNRDEAMISSKEGHALKTIKPDHRILVTVEGGVIQGIENIPPNIVVEVRDFDKNGDRSHPTWSEEHQAFVGEWTGPDLPATAPYQYRRGSDGTDQTFDVYRDGDERPMVSVGYWHQEAEAEATARLIVEALNQHAARLGRSLSRNPMRDALETIARMQMDGEDGFELTNDDAVDSLHSCIRLARDALA